MSDYLNAKELEQIADFLESDSYDLDNVLVIDEDGDYLERYSLNSLRNCVLASDKEIIAISLQNQRILDEVCDDCPQCDCCKDADTVLHCAIALVQGNHDAYQQYLIDVRELEGDIHENHKSF